MGCFLCGSDDELVKIYIKINDEDVEKMVCRPCKVAYGHSIYKQPKPRPVPSWKLKED